MKFALRQPGAQQGVTRLAANEATGDQVVAEAKAAARAIQELLAATQSTGGAAPRLSWKPRAAGVGWRAPDGPPSRREGVRGRWERSGAAS